MSNLVSLTCPSLQILDKSQTGLFLISGFLVKSVINKNCHNSRTINNIGIKLGPATKLEIRKTTTAKTFDDHVMSANDDVIVIYPIYC